MNNPTPIKLTRAGMLILLAALALLAMPRRAGAQALWYEMHPANPFSAQRAMLFDQDRYILISDPSSRKSYYGAPGKFLQGIELFQLNAFGKGVNGGGAILRWPMQALGTNYCSASPQKYPNSATPVPYLPIRGCSIEEYSGNYPQIYLSGLLNEDVHHNAPIFEGSTGFVSILDNRFEVTSYAYVYKYYMTNTAIKALAQSSQALLGGLLESLELITGIHTIEPHPTKIVTDYQRYS